MSVNSFNAKRCEHELIGCFFLVKESLQSILTEFAELVGVWTAQIAELSNRTFSGNTSFTKSTSLITGIMDWEQELSVKHKRLLSPMGMRRLHTSPVTRGFIKQTLTSAWIEWHDLYKGFVGLSDITFHEIFYPFLILLIIGPCALLWVQEKRKNETRKVRLWSDNITTRICKGLIAFYVHYSIWPRLNSKINSKHPCNYF